MIFILSYRGAALARLSYLVFEIRFDYSGSDQENMDSRIAQLDKLMRALTKPRIVVAAGDNVSDGEEVVVFKAEKWPSISVADLVFGEYRPQCEECETSPCCALPVEDGAVPPIKEARYSKKRPPCAAKVGASGDCYICFEHDATSVMLPCGHSGLCYPCAIENMSRCETCPCCRRAVDQVVVFDRASRHTAEGGRVAYRVIGPGARKKEV